MAFWRFEFGGVRRGDDVDDHGSSAAAKHPEHLTDCALRIGKMMDREAGHDAVELRIRERQVLGIAAFEFDVGQSGLVAA